MEGGVQRGERVARGEKRGVRVREMRGVCERGVR